ncbi:MAG: SDR family oxidoreductase [Akkermansiaceae bacterium]
MKLPRVVLSGGEGDLAKALSVSLHNAEMEVITLGKKDLDVRDSSQVKACFKELGNIDLLICNAGLVTDVALARMTEADWDQVMKVNLKGAFLCAREAARGMAKLRTGHIVFISSFSALHPPKGQANYAASKAALHGMMKSLASELGSRNVRVNLILPGFLETKMTADLTAVVKASNLNKHVLGRYNTKESVAEFVAFLHHQMQHTSGQVFNLDSRILA